MNNRVQNYSEFGLGGSTLEAIRLRPKNVVAIDTDLSWVDASKTHPEIGKAITEGWAEILHCDIGPVGEWGYPLNTDRLTAWHTYLSKPWAEWARRGALPDLIYVDGRFRVACCCSIAAVFADTKKTPHVLMHDFADDRPSYKRTLQFFDIEEQIGKLALLHLKRDNDRAKIISALLSEQFELI